jgi:hypothetical protein
MLCWPVSIRYRWRRFNLASFSVAPSYGSILASLIMRLFWGIVTGAYHAIVSIAPVAHASPRKKQGVSCKAYGKLGVKGCLATKPIECLRPRLRTMSNEISRARVKRPFTGPPLYRHLSRATDLSGK